MKAKESKGAGAEVPWLLTLCVLYSIRALVLAINAIECITEDARPHAAVRGPVEILQITPSGRIAFSMALPKLDESGRSGYTRSMFG